MKIGFQNLFKLLDGRDLFRIVIPIIVVAVPLSYYEIKNRHQEFKQSQENQLLKQIQQAQLDLTPLSKNFNLTDVQIVIEKLQELQNKHNLNDVLLIKERVGKKEGYWSVGPSGDQRYFEDLQEKVITSQFDSKDKEITLAAITSLDAKSFLKFKLNLTQKLHSITTKVITNYFLISCSIYFLLLFATYLIRERNQLIQKTITNTFGNLEHGEYHRIDLNQVPRFWQSFFKNLDRFSRSIMTERKEYKDRIQFQKRELIKVKGDEEKSELQYQTILNAVDKVILKFNQRGRVTALSPNRSYELFEKDINSKFLWEVFPSIGADFKDWFEMASMPSCPLSPTAILDLAPSTWNFHQKHFQLSYTPIGNKFEGCIFITDVTHDVESEAKSQKNLTQAEMVRTILSHKTFFQFFIKESVDLISNCRKAYAKMTEKDFSHKVLGVLHTLKGGASTFRIDDLAELIDRYEEKIKTEDLSSEELLLMISTIDSMLMVKTETLKEQYREVFDDENYAKIPRDQLNDFIDQIKDRNLSRKFKRLFFTESLADLMEQYSLTLDEASSKLGKSLKPLRITGDEHRVYPTELQELFSALIHVFRNMVDHGIETPEERIAAGKDPEGQVSVDIRFERGTLNLSIFDDGRGVDLEKLTKRVDDMGIDTSDLTPEQILDYVFHPELSTRDHASIYSGRGVGLSLVREAAKHLGGDVRIESTPGQGTKIILHIIPSSDILLEMIA